MCLRGVEMGDRSRMIRTAYALPVGDRDRRRILSELVLRDAAIRLAASLPVGSQARSEVVRTIVAADEDAADAGAKLEKLTKKNDLSPDDILDLTAYIVDSPVSAGQPSDVLVDNFKSWWGGSFPLPWRDMSKGDVGKVVEAAIEVIPVAIAAISEASKASKGGKKASTSRSASFIAVMAVATTIAHEAKKQEEAEAYRKRRQREKEQQDGKYKPSSKPQPVSVYSAKEDKHVTFEGKDAQEKARDLEYAEYKWASDLVGREPVSRKEWGQAMMRPGLESLSRNFRDEAGDIDRLKAHNNVAYLASTVGDAYRDGKRGDDLRKQVERRLNDKTDSDREWHRTMRKGIADREAARHLHDELQRFKREEESSAGFFEKAIGFFAPDWAEGKAGERAKARQEAQKGRRTYDDYLKSKKHGDPISREEWEARFGR